MGAFVSIVSLGAVVWWASRQSAPNLPSSASGLSLIALAIVVYALGTTLRSERWLMLLREDGANASRRDAFGLTLVGFMGNNVLPARGGDGLRVYLMAPRADASYRGVIGTLVAERILDAVTLLTLFCVLAYGVLRGINAPGPLVLVAIAAGLGTFVVAYVLLHRVGAKHERGRRLIQAIAPMATATRDLRSRHGLRMAGFTVAIWLAEALTFYLVAHGVDIAIDPIEALYLVALASVFILIPSGPGYAGTLDAAILFGMDAVGASGGEAVSYLIMLRFVLLVPITTAGLIVLVTGYGGWRNWARSREGAPA